MLPVCWMKIRLYRAALPTFLTYTRAMHCMLALSHAWLNSLCTAAASIVLLLPLLLLHAHIQSQAC
jgi:hypothetical protein